MDDIRVANPASNEKLFTAAAAHLVKNQFDLKALMRTILQSETYQRSSLALPENQADTRYLARFYPRRLKAEVLLDAFSAATAVPTTFRIDARNANRGLGRMYPEGFRALQLPDSNVASYFLKSFGRPERLATCECERTSEPSMAQALHLANGDTLNDKLAKRQPPRPIAREENVRPRTPRRNLPPHLEPPTHPRRKSQAHSNPRHRSRPPPRPRRPLLEPPEQPGVFV